MATILIPGLGSIAALGAAGPPVEYTVSLREPQTQMRSGARILRAPL